MKRFLLLFAMVVFLQNTSFAKILYVYNPPLRGVYPFEYSSIQEAHDKALKGDTVRILPGIYNVPNGLVFSKDIVIQGAGIQNTIIVSDNADFPVIRMSGGKLMWVRITSYRNDGVWINNATIYNCLFLNNAGAGVASKGKGGIIVNCLSINNNFGYYNEYQSEITIINSIAYLNKRYGFTQYSNFDKFVLRNCVAFKGGFDTRKENLFDCLEVDPGLSIDDGTYICTNPRLINAGEKTLLDPDGTISDIGYYGGPNAPIFPYLINPVVEIQEDGTLKFEVKGKIGY